MSYFFEFIEEAYEQNFGCTCDMSLARLLSARSYLSSSGRDASIPSRYGKYKKGFQEAEEAARQGGNQPDKEKKGGPAWIPGKANPR